MSHSSIRPSISSRTVFDTSSQQNENANHHKRPPSLTQSQPKSSYDSAPSSFIRTRSMTRLSGVLDENKLARIDRATGKVAGPQEKEKGKVVSGAGAATAARRPLGAKMQAQMGLGGGMKRRLGSPGMPKKRMKVDEARKKMVVLADKEEVHGHEQPRTPAQLKGATVQVQPTPARDILSAGAPLKEENEEADDDEDSPGLRSRFIARPPTPPRPHIHLRPSPVKVEPLVTTSMSSPTKRMDLDSPERHAVSHSAVTPTRPSSFTTSSIPRITPQTPRTALQTPRRVMGSVSRFRAAPPSVNRSAISPVKSSPTAGTVLASILAATDAEPTTTTGQTDDTAHHRNVEEVRDQIKGEIGSTETVDDHSAHPEPVTNELEGQNASALPVLPRQNNSTQSGVATPSSTAVKPAMVQSKLSFSPAPLPKASSASSAMLPPSRIPRAASKMSLSTSTEPDPTADRPKKSSLPISTKPSLSSLGRGLPSAASSMSLSAGTSSEPAPVRRKPSYPSSLGSGPLNRPRDRMVSGPTLYHQRDGTLATSKGESSIPKGRQSPRSVSEPAPRAQPRADLSASTSRREGMSMETSKSMAGLSDALNKLKMRKSESLSEPNRHRPLTSLSIAAPASRAPLAGPSAFKQPALPVAASSSRISNVHRPRQSIAPLTMAPADISMTHEEEQVGDRSLAAILSTTTETKCFKGVVAFVDVRTADGEDASPIFVEMLKSLGARVNC